MKGKLIKQDDSWYVMRLEENEWETYYHLHPADIEQIKQDSLSFDNIEARITAYPEVEFEIEDFWETGLEKIIKVAKLK